MKLPQFSVLASGHADYEFQEDNGRGWVLFLGTLTAAFGWDDSVLLKLNTDRLPLRDPLLQFRLG